MRQLPILLVLLVSGCAYQETPVSQPQQVVRPLPYDAELIAADKIKREKAEAEGRLLWQRRNAALTDGRIKVGMTVTEFKKVWEHDKATQNDVSESHFAGHDMVTVDYVDYTGGLYVKRQHVIFTFDNGVLDSWHDYNL